LTKVTTTTDYVGGFVYTNNSLQFFSSPEGRVVKKGTAYEYQYAIADHQGNTRVVFSSAPATPVAVKATFEGDATDQSTAFTNVSNVVTMVAANQTAGGSKVVRMNQGYSVGPSKSMKVFTGDKIDVEVYAYYEQSSGWGTTNAPQQRLRSFCNMMFGYPTKMEFRKFPWKLNFLKLFTLVLHFYLVACYDVFLFVIFKFGNTPNLCFY
jgi:hypothetical protein